MVSADTTLFVAGPPDVVDEEDAFFAMDDSIVLDKLAEQSALLESAEGSRLWAVSATDGQVTNQYTLDSLPVWDGMIAAGGKLFLTTVNGEAICLSD